MKQGTAKAIDRSAVLLATLCLAGNAYGVPSAGLWTTILHGRSFVLLVLLLVVGVFGAFTPFETWRARTSSGRSVAMRRHILSTFGTILEMSHAIQPPLAMGDLALHVWRRRRGPRHPLQGTLKRVATYRMATFPANRSFSPGKGVGAIGMCWEKNGEIQFDAAEIAEKLTTQAEFDEFAAESGRPAVMNLSWQQFNDVKHRAALFVVPIRNGRSRFIGCISVDASRGFSELNRRELLEEMTKLGMAIGVDDFQFV